MLADPANLESKPQKAMQAGQVWFPDSAYKTAQAIQDFNIGEGLPLLVLANWRGFSGGRKDMFEEVLKFGSFIVDQLTQFKQPIMVYIPPHCEIEAAWVDDSTINPRCMEMYAAEHAAAACSSMGSPRSSSVSPSSSRCAPHRQAARWMSMNEASGVVREDIAMRETSCCLIPAARRSSTCMTGQGMLAKGVIEIVGWKGARSYFYWRLKRRLAEMRYAEQMATDKRVSYDDAAKAIAATLPASDREAYEALVGVVDLEGAFVAE